MASRKDQWSRIRSASSAWAIMGLLLLPPAVPVHAAGGDGGSVAADFLRLDVGAAAAAQGGAYAGRSGGIEVFAFNPAGLARADRNEIMFQHNSHLLDVNHEYLAAVYRISRWSVAGSFSYLDGGEQTRRTISNPGGTGLPGFTNNTVMASLGGATGIGNGLSVGATAKIFQENLDSSKRAGFALDLGMHYMQAGRAYEAGVVLRNIGPQVSFDATGEDLPLEAAVGGSGEFMNEKLRLSFEGVWPRNQDLYFKSGLEVRVIDFLALRAGYNSRIDLGSGVSAGLGISISNIEFDYAWVDYGRAGSAHRAALKLGF